MCRRRIPRLRWTGRCCRWRKNLLASNGLDPQHAAAALTAVSFDSYHYQQPAFYTPEAMAALLGEYKAMGWKHLVNANQTVANTAQPKQAVTDLWLHFSGGDIDGVTVLMRAQPRYERGADFGRPAAAGPAEAERSLRDPEGGP